MTSSLTPERPLLISPTLAATIGLEEAVLLHVISELQTRNPTQVRQQREWFTLSPHQLQEATPFWQANDLTRIRQSLIDKGVLLCEAVGSGETLTAINQKASHAPATRPSRPPSGKTEVFAGSRQGRATRLPEDWHPDDVLFQQCESQHGIPRDFIVERLPSFIMVQSERGSTRYSWHNECLKWMVKEWQKEKSYQGTREQESRMSRDWQPSRDAMDIVEHAGIPRDFIADCVPEFVLYWTEMRVVNSAWNTKFIQHVRRQWAKYSAEVGSDNNPSLISPDFSPSAACYEVLGMANIDAGFAREQIPEFILYWRERGEASASWNTKFLQHVKFKWANRPQAGLPASEQLEHTIARMTDRSWAE